MRGIRRGKEGGEECDNDEAEKGRIGRTKRGR
jgi:hypothetical protein